MRRRTMSSPTWLVSSVPAAGLPGPVFEVETLSIAVTRRDGVVHDHIGPAVCSRNENHSCVNSTCRYGDAQLGVIHELGLVEDHHDLQECLGSICREDRPVFKRREIT